MDKRQAFTAKEKLAVVVRLKMTGDTAATVARFFPNLSGPAAAARRKLVWGGDAVKRSCVTSARL